jgi:hypothetical protein
MSQFRSYVAIWTTDPARPAASNATVVSVAALGFADEGTHR